MPITTATYKPWMVFVDGENLTIRAQGRANRLGRPLPQGALHRKDVYFWCSTPGITRDWISNAHAADFPERMFYYSAMSADEEEINAVRDELLHENFTPVVFKKKQKRSKAVDVSLTKDLLVNAYLNNYDIAVLVAGDGDYVPVVQEIKRIGKRVVIAFFGDGDGLSPELRREGDGYVCLDHLI